MADILGLCLFRAENYDLVLTRVTARSIRRVIDGHPPSGQALSQSRSRLGEDVMPVAFARHAAQMPTLTPQCFAFGLLVTAFDRTVFDLPATADIRAGFAVPCGGRWIRLPSWHGG